MATAPPIADQKKPAVPAPAKAATPAAKPSAPVPTGSSAGSQQRFDRMAVRAKLAVSQPGDALEREADAMADKVMRMPEPVAAQGPKGAPVEAPRAAPNAAPKAIQRETAAASPGGPVDPSLRDEAVAAVPPDAQSNAPQTHADLIARLGPGEPLDAQARAFFEHRLGRDLGDVCIHADAQAADAARSLQARAFAWGHHIAFASGAYQPGSEAGRRLLAHELAHVLQNDSMAISQVIARKPATDKYKDANDVGRDAMDPKLLKQAEPDLQTLRVPSIKSRHAVTLYQGLAGKSLARPKGFDRAKNPTKQKSIWLEEMKIQGEAAWFRKIGFDPDASGNKLPFFGKDGETITGSATEIKEMLKIPRWSPDGRWRSMQVDHMVEVQVYENADQMSNFELLSGAHNMNVGSLLKVEIYANVRKFLAAVGKNNGEKKVKEYLDNNEVPFKKVVAGGEGKHLEASSQFWSQNDIKTGKHLTWLIDEKRKKREDGNTPGTFVLKSPTGQAFIESFAVTPKGEIHGTPTDHVAGLKIAKIDLKPKFHELDAGEVGSLSGEWTLPPKIRKTKASTLTLPLMKIPGLKYAGALGELPGHEADIPGASPLTFTQIGFLRGAVDADGELAPTLPLLADVKIPVEWRGKDLRFDHRVPLEKLKDKFKVPGLTVDEASLVLFFGSEGLGAEGGVEFTIAGLGRGELSASVSTKGAEPVFQMSGLLMFEAGLFDEATLQIAYDSENGFSGKGHLGITKPDKITGIQSASIDAGFTRDEFFAEGGVVPKIPGLQSVGIKVAYSKVSNTLTIHGDVALDAGLPGVESGTIAVDVAQHGDDWKVAASGQIKPKFKGLGPGLMLTAGYEDGRFNLKVEGVEIKFGENDRFKGTISAGLTNQAVDADGNVSGDGGDTIRPYGKGDLKGQLAKWLEVDITATIDTQGDVFLQGGLTVPSLPIFERQSPFGDSAEKKLFGIDTPKIPIVGISVGGVGLGITAHVSGDLFAVCWAGPATLDGVHLTVGRFRPDTDDPLSLQGGGDLNLPAYAGLKLKVIGNIDLDAGLVALGGDLTAEASLGADAHFNSHLALAWSKEKGVDILDTTALTISPKLAFDVKGGFHVDVNALVTSFRVWHKEWELGHFEYGPDFKLSTFFEVGYNDKDGFFFKPADPSEGAAPDLGSTSLYEGLLKDHPKEEQLAPDADAPPGTQTLGYGDVCEEQPKVLASYADAPSSSLDGGSGMMPKEDPQAPVPGEVPWRDSAELGRELGAGEPLPPALRARFERRFGADFAGVRIHRNGKAARAARRAAAQAFTVGEHIAFAEGAARPGSAEGEALLAHELAHVAQQQGTAPRERTGQALLRWPAVTPTEAHSTESPATVRARTLASFSTLTQTQLDWATSPLLQADAVTLTQLRALRDFAEEAQVVKACGGLNVGQLIDKGVATIAPPLRKYTEGVTGHGTAWLRHTDKVGQAERWGDHLSRLEGAWAPADLALVMPAADPVAAPSPFEQLDDPGRFELDHFIAYLRMAPKPVLSADNGAEVSAFLDLRAEGAMPTDYATRVSHVRTYHHFTKATLEGLAANEAVPPLMQQFWPTRRPLTVVLYPSVDHSGAFHRNLGLEAMVTGPGALTIVLEGMPTVADYTAALDPIAKRYGIGGKIAQAMVAGHGNYNVLALAGSVAGGKVAGDDLGTSGAWGANTAALTTELLRLMSGDPARRRIVLDACLTNSHAVGAALRATPADAAADVAKAMAANPSLRDVVAKLAGPNVFGSNASFAPGETAFVTPGDPVVGLGVPGDPDLIAGKLAYVEFGSEPEGCLRALLECWSHDIATGTHDARDAVTRRLGLGRSSHIAPAHFSPWREGIVQSLYKLALNPFWNNGEMIRQLGDLAGKLFELYWPKHVTVGALDASLAVLAGNVAHVDAVLGSMTAQPEYGAQPRIAAALDQVWMQYNPARLAPFMATLALYTSCQEAAIDIDMRLVMPIVPSQLTLPPVLPPPGGQLRLALLAASHAPLVGGALPPFPAHVEYLRALLGAGPNFAPALGVDAVLGGLMSEADLLAAIGRPLVETGPPPPPGKGPPPRANIDPLHDVTQRNDFHVTPLRAQGRVTIRSAQLMVRSTPTTSTDANIVGRLANGDTFLVIGEFERWYVIEQPGTAGFVAKAYVTLF